MKHIQAMTVKCLLQRRVDPLSGWSYFLSVHNIGRSIASLVIILLEAIQYIASPM